MIHLNGSLLYLADMPSNEIRKACCSNILYFDKKFNFTTAVLTKSVPWDQIFMRLLYSLCIICSHMVMCTCIFFPISVVHVQMYL